MTKSRSNSSAPAAKGQLVVGTGTDASGILSVSSNGDTLVANSAASVGLSYSATPSASNPILNSSFDVWQRGTSFTAVTSNNTYTADRWTVGSSSTFSAYISRQTTSDSTNLPFVEYCARVGRTSGNTSTNGITFIQSMESTNSIPFANKTVTMSFYARKGADYSAASSNLTVYLMSGTGTDQSGQGAITGGAFPINSTATLTTTWQRFTFTGTVGSTVTQLFPYFLFTPVGTAGSNDYYEITGVQIDVGNVALPFRRAVGTIQGELAAAQRYYYRTSPGATGNRFGVGWNRSTTVHESNTFFPVTMRTAPTALEQSGTANHYSVFHANTSTACSAVPTFTTANQHMASTSFTVASGLTAGQGSATNAANASAFLGWSAEL
jgi:hypothetical protein